MPNPRENDIELTEARVFYNLAVKHFEKPTSPPEPIWLSHMSVMDDALQWMQSQSTYLDTFCK